MSSNLLKFRVKYSASKKFVLHFKGQTVADLNNAVRNFVKDTYGEECEGKTLSLNGKDILSDNDSALIFDVGVRSGDLLMVIDRPSDDHKGAAVATSNFENKSDDVSVKNRPELLLDVDASKDETHLPESLMLLLQHLSPKDASQIINILAHITMLECNFIPTDGGAGVLTGADGKVLHCPGSGWDQSVASLGYMHKDFVHFTCTLVIVSMGPTKQMLVSFPGQDQEIDTKLILSEYFKNCITDKVTAEKDLINVSRLARHLRNQLVYPLQLAAHRLLKGVPSLRQLDGLPTEICIVMLRKLDVRTALRLSCCCKRFSSLIKDDIALWRHYYLRDFGRLESAFNADDTSNNKWLKAYKDRYLEKQHPMPRGVDDFTFDVSQPRAFPQPRIYPTNPFHPEHPLPFAPHPIGPYPVVPDPSLPFNPFGDPDSPYFGGDIPNRPPQFPHVQPPRRRDPLNPFGDPSFGGLGPGLRGRRPSPGSGPGFRYI